MFNLIPRDPLQCTQPGVFLSAVYGLLCRIAPRCHYLPSTGDLATLNPGGSSEGKYTLRGVGSGWLYGAGGRYGGPVQIACSGVELNENFNPARRHGGLGEVPWTNHSSRNYPSMFHFVITGVIGF